LSKRTAEQSFPVISFYAGKVLERLQCEEYVSSVFLAEFYCYFLNKGTAEKLSKRTAEQIEGYVSSLNKGTAVQSFTAISQGYTVISQSFTAISQSFNAISLYAGIQLERPLNKGTAVQSFTAIS
ncbi:hypothetical protein P7K49_040570, partial [Saguinus oedipus]